MRLSPEPQRTALVVALLELFPRRTARASAGYLQRREAAVSAARLLDRLDGVKQTGPQRWLAKCPAHADRSPSLSIRELDDGRILIHDFGGCGAAAVVEALGLTLADLFEKPLGDFAAVHSRIPARDLLEILSEETSVVAFIATDLLERRLISPQGWQRLAEAAARIGRARDHAYGR